MFGLSAFASRPFNSLVQAIQPIITWGRTGGIKKHEEVKKSKRAEIQEHIKEIFAEPVVDQEIVEKLQVYTKEQQAFSPFSIDYKQLAKDMETVQRIVALAQEIKQEREDEEILLMLV